MAQTTESDYMKYLINLDFGSNNSKDRVKIKKVIEGVHTRTHDVDGLIDKIKSAEGYRTIGDLYIERTTLGGMGSIKKDIDISHRVTLCNPETGVRIKMRFYSNNGIYLPDDNKISISRLVMAEDPEFNILNNSLTNLQSILNRVNIETKKGFSYNVNLADKNYHKK